MGGLPTSSIVRSTTTTCPKDTVELMRRLGIESGVIVGYSDGGIIGLDIAVITPRA
jgi:pimeloyl-ACP methyl ester carboxylesterase